jgi:hypothetical protein
MKPKLNQKKTRKKIRKNLYLRKLNLWKAFRLLKRRLLQTIILKKSKGVAMYQYNIAIVIGLE